MVQVIEADNSWVDALRQLGGGLVGGYTERADENAIKKAISDLGENPQAKDVINAITNTKTYNPQSKANYIGNFAKSHGIDLEERKFKEEQRKAQEQERLKEREIDVQEKRINRSDKQAEKVNSIKAGLNTVQRMKDLGKKGNLGRGSTILKEFGGETAKDFSQYEQAGKSLIQLSTTIPIRNRDEFKALAHNLYDPSLPDKAREGILDEMTNILQDSLLAYESGEIEDLSEAIDAQKKQFSPSLDNGKVKVRNKATGKTGTVTPFEGMDAKYERI